MKQSTIYSYTSTREQALRDRVLVDITLMANRAGFSYPVAVTSRVWGLVVQPAIAKGKSIHCRLWDLLMALKTAVKYQSAGDDRIRFPVIFDNRPGEEYRGESLWAMIQMGDDHKPVITIMQEDEASDHDHAGRKELIKKGLMPASGPSL
ncbi:MAG: DUF6573 family protein [Candidatus Deferrimicrobiaceae bacterium]